MEQSEKSHSPLQNQITLPDLKGLSSAFPVKQIPEAGFVIIGGGQFGDKIKQLLDKTPTLGDIGFYTPQRTGLAEGFFDGFFRSNGLGENLHSVAVTKGLEAKIQNGSLTKEELQVLQKICDLHTSRFLVIRSSAGGDSRGTGIYKSVFSANGVEAVNRSVLKVIASYFSKDAVAFRRDAKMGEEFGVMIEPVIGQDIDQYFAPILSGFGYTSTSRGEAYIRVVPGLGGGVETKNGEKITRSSIERYGNLGEYISQERDKMYPYSEDGPVRNSSLLGIHNGNIRDRYSITACCPPWNPTDDIIVATYVKQEELEPLFHGLNLNPLFDMIESMEKEFKRPQYFEWAMTIESGNPRYWITQMADVDKRLDLMDFGNIRNVMFMGNNVTGTGEKECSKIVDCWNPDDIESLRKFNENNTGYVLFYAARLVSTVLGRLMHYSDYSNAAVFIERQDVHRGADPVSHLIGELDVTGKFVAVLDYNAEIPPDNNKLTMDKQQGLMIYPGKVRVISSERQDKLVICAMD